MNKISMMEIMLLSITVVVSTAVLFLPYLTAQAAGQDAWISVFLAGFLACLPAWATGVVMSKFPKQSIIQALPKLLGKALGKLVALVYLGFFLFATVIVIWQLEEFVVGTLVPETPGLAVRLFFLFALAFAAFSGTVPLIRTNAYITPVGIVVIALVIGLPITRMDPSFLFPIFEDGIRPTVDGAIILLGWLCQIPVVVLMFHRYVQEKFLHQTAKKAVLGVLVAALALEVGALGTIAAFGPQQTASMYYPSFAVARIISIGAFLEHIEVTFVAVWIAAMFIAGSFYVQALGDGISDIFNVKGKGGKEWIFIGIFAVLVIGPALIDWDLYMLIFLIRNVAPIAAIVAGGIIPLMLLVRVLVAPVPEAGRKDYQHQNPGDSDADMDTKTNKDGDNQKDGDSGPIE